MKTAISRFLRKTSGKFNPEREQLFSDCAGQVEAINKSQAVIEFKLDGTILQANDNFLDVMGYSADEVQGNHHSMFVDEATKNSREYEDFWKLLNTGEFVAREFKRIGKGGKEVWIQASYNPIFDQEGRLYKIVKYASDVTRQKKINSDFSSQIDAINKSQAVIEFSMDGTVEFANDNFLNALGYTLEEIKGKHHRIFVDPAYATSSEYEEFWNILASGTYHSGEFERFGKNGNSVWINASYNPILDLNGKPYKVIKYASDITEQKELQQMVERVLDETSQAMKAMSNGDLTRRIECEFTGEFGQLKDAVNDCFENLEQAISGIESVAASVGMGSSEIAQGNLNLSERTEEQASMLEQTASSMEQITSTVQQNASNAHQATELAQHACDKATNGGAIVKTAVDAMEELSTASKKIADIIGVIDEIAFQTNLLALNASVEAARAGEQGRGFAVVASEVRNLAGRSASSAKEIKELIEDSGRRVNESASLVNKSGESLKEIVEGVIQVSGIVSEISTASNEQAEGISEVNKAVSQMDDLTQQNAALVEQAAAGSEHLNGQATSLMKLVSTFKIAGKNSPAKIETSEKARSVEEPVVERRSKERPWASDEQAQPEPLAPPTPVSTDSTEFADDGAQWESF